MVFFDGLGDGCFDFSVTLAGEDFGLGLGFVRGPVCVVVVRRSEFVVEGVMVLPGVVTESEVTAVVVVVVVCAGPLMRLRT
ncbi:MAG: hypothetical protein QOI07_408 [Verrucomicrobiota bacterium]